MGEGRYRSVSLFVLLAIIFCIQRGASSSFFNNYNNSTNGPVTDSKSSSLTSYLNRNGDSHDSDARSLASSSKRQPLPYPDFFLIGIMKGGTTSLNKLLTEHPDICDEGEKEKHYFDKEKDYADGPKSYLAEFAKCRKDEYTLDSTPKYISETMAPVRIKESYTPEDLKKKKFLLILREPVARHYSEYQMRLRLCLKVRGDDGKGKIRGRRSLRGLVSGGEEEEEEEEEVRYSEAELRKGFYNVTDNRNSETMTFTEKMMEAAAIERARNLAKADVDEEGRDERSCGRVTFANGEPMTFAQWVKSPDGRHEVHRGRYHEHIANWLQYIPRNQIFIMNFDMLIYNTTFIMDRVQKFLELKKTFPHNDKNQVELPKPHSTHPQSILDCSTYNALARHYSKVNSALISFINGAQDRPVDEPTFPDFNVGAKSSCVGRFNADGKQLDDFEGDDGSGGSGDEKA